MSIKKEIMWRVALIYVAAFLMSIAIIARILYLQFIEVGELTKKAMQLSLKDIEITPNRGDILASNGGLLATAVPFYEIRVDVSRQTISNDLFYENLDSLAFCMTKVFKDKSKAQYRKEFVDARKQNQRYYLLKRKVNFEDLKAMRKFPLFRLGKYKGGFIVIPNSVRFQPYGNLASRTIGYLSKSEEGNLVGIEGSFDNDLRGTKGVKLMQRLPGNVWMPVADENEVEPKDGYDVVTTIDLQIQDVATTALQNQLIRHNAHHGTAILMEVKTGQVKAISNLERDEKGNYRETYNYGIAESTEPGSTFKLASLMAAMEDGYIGLDDTINTGNGKFQIYDKEIRDTEEKGHGKITVEQIFEFSSNVGVAKIVQKYYKGKEKQFIDRLYSFGLNKPLNLQLKGEGTPEIKYPGDKYWSGISMAMMAHGYEVRMTPLQILTFYNAVANDGKMVRPKFVNELQYHGKLIKSFGTEVLNPSICSMSTIRKAHKMLEGVVDTGTARNLRNPNYKIGGKTGTAQIAKAKSGYRQDAAISYQASFVGYFPADNPMYSCIVVVNAPSNSVYYGNLVAGPVFKEIADKVYATSFELHNYIISGKKSLKTEAPFSKNGFWNDTETALDELGIPIEEDRDIKSDWVVTTTLKEEVKVANKRVINNLVPDVSGMGLKDAMFLLENAGLRVNVNGYGKVVRQSMMPGIRVIRGATVGLEMSN